MHPRVDLVTLGVTDLSAARHFYVEGLGWRPIFEVPGEVVFLQIGHGLALGLFGRAALDADAGDARRGDLEAGAPPISLAQIVETEEEVVAILAAAQAAGARILKTPQKADFGGFHGYFADPSGFRWEVATNSGWHVGPDGTIVIGPVE
jgi:catechol 2,3-dioxygenase-like lactoylglutathione lyase family enzyme